MPLNQHQLLKTARKAGTARTDQGQTFKKPFQMVMRPQTIHHNMHDDFVRNPPKVHATSPVDKPSTKSIQNVTEGEISPRSNPKWVVPHKSAIRGGQEGMGRVKHSDFESELIQESSVHA